MVSRTFLLIFCNALISVVDAVDSYRAAVYGHNATYVKDRTKIIQRDQALAVMIKNIDCYKQEASLAAKMVSCIIRICL